MTLHILTLILAQANQAPQISIFEPGIIEAPSRIRRIAIDLRPDHKIYNVLLFPAQPFYTEGSEAQVISPQLEFSIGEPHAFLSSMRKLNSFAVPGAKMPVQPVTAQEPKVRLDLAPSTNETKASPVTFPIRFEPFSVPFGSMAVKDSQIVLPHDPAPNSVAELILPKAKVVEVSTRASAPQKLIPALVASKVKVEPEMTRCSLTGVDMEFSKALKFITSNTGLNLLLIAPNAPKITVQLKDVTALEMLQHLCAMGGMSYLKVGTTYAIASEATLKGAYPTEWNTVHPVAATTESNPSEAVVEDVVEVVTINYLNMKEVTELVSRMFKKVTAMAGPGYTSPSLVQKDSAGATGATSQSMTRDASDGLSRTLLLQGPRGEVNKAKLAIKSLDQPRRQVSIEVKVLDISNDALRDLGIQWSPSGITLKESQGKGVNFGSITRAPLSFAGLVSTLENANKAKTLANPNVSVIDGEKGFILIGDKINFPLLVGYTANNTPIFDKQTERVGIYLQVAASIADDGSITMSLYPQVSTITGFLNVNGASYPQVSTREAQTSLTVKNGETFVMGGLIQTKDIENMERMPLLGNIPVLGELFTHRKRTKVSSQIVISITPRITNLP